MARILLGIAESAESEPVKLAAVKDALDRAGLSAKHAVELSAAEAKPAAPYEELLGDVAFVQKAQHEAAKRGEPIPPTAPFEPEHERPQPELEMVDAELVDLPPEDAARGRKPPPWAEDADMPSASPRGQLVTLEEGNAWATEVNRIAGVTPPRRIKAVRAHKSNRSSS